MTELPACTAEREGRKEERKEVEREGRKKSGGRIKKENSEQKPWIDSTIERERERERERENKIPS